MNKKESGLSSLGLLLVLVAGAAVLLVVFRIGPLYIDNYFVESSVESLRDEDIMRMSDGQIRAALERYFMVNGVRDMSSRDAKIEREAKRIVVKLDYEKRVDLIGNLDVVVTFENRLDTMDY